MSENKKLLKYTGILFLLVLLTYPMPYHSASIIEYFIRPIGTNGGRLYVSGLVPLALFVIAIRGLFKLERFQERSKILIFIAVILIVLPVMQWTVDVGRTTFHRVSGHQLQAVDFVEGDISLFSSEEEVTIHSSLTVKDYGRGQNRFYIRLHLPESLQQVTRKEYYDFEQEYLTRGHRREKVIKKQFTVSRDEIEESVDFHGLRWHEEDIEYTLYNDGEAVTLTNHGW